jgi:hypothetical protein
MPQTSPLSRRPLAADFRDIPDRGDDVELADRQEEIPTVRSVSTTPRQ